MIRPEDVRNAEDLRPMYEAGQALHDFAVAHRPPGYADDDPAAGLIFKTYVRASKTFQGAWKLAYDGYGAQAFILGRALYEDMLVAHWIKLNATTAPAQFERHARLHQATLRVELDRVGLGDRQQPDPVARDERASLRQEFGSRHWTKQSMDKLKDSVRSEFPVADSHRRLLEQVHGVLHRYGNLVAHNSFLSLDGAVVELDNGRRVADVSASPMFISKALFIAFFSYVHLITLVLGDRDQEELTSLWHRHSQAFTTLREGEAE